MFKSIEYKLYIYTILLIAATVASTYFTIHAEYVYMVLSVIAVIFLLLNMRRSYNQYNKNIIFLLNALDNGDYSFNFSVTKLSRRERELNQMMNRIKDILSKVRKEVIENEQFLSVIMESVSTGIIIMDEHNMVLKINRTVNELLGLPVFTHINQLANIDKEFPELFRTLERSDTKIIKIANEREETQLSVRASEVMLQGKRLKVITLNSIGSELDYKEMDSWMRLIRVMTHEIMNSVAPVTSLTDTLLTAFRQNKPKDDDFLIQNTIEALQTINSTTKGLIDFVNSYRRFTGIPKPQLHYVSLQTVVEQTVSLQKTNLTERGIDINLNFPDNLVMINIDESQVTQVLLNLLKNAAEALSADGGQIKIELSQEKQKIHLDICNNGAPISDEVLPNIFVPFYTTKDSGSGIGLSLSRYIMRLHGGTLIHFTRGEWTVFRMTFQDTGKVY